MGYVINPSLWLIVIYFSSIISNSSAFYPKQSFVNDDPVVKKWEKASKYFDQIAWSQRDVLIKTLGEFLDESSGASSKISKDCFESLQYVDQGLKERKLWAYQMLDAWSRGSVSILSGSLGDEGKGPECAEINVHIRKTKRDVFSFSGRQCLATIGWPVPEVNPRNDTLDPMMALRLNVSNTGLANTIYEFYADRLEFWYRETLNFGICVPSKCSKEDILYMLGTKANGTDLKVGLRKFCDSVEDRKAYPVPLMAWISFWILMVIAFIVIFSTLICTIMDKARAKDKWNLLRHFDMRASHYKLTHVDIKNPAQLQMRPMDMFISIAQIFAICGHALIAGVITPSVFPVFKEYRDLFGKGFIASVGKQYIFYLTMGAQAWFCISGFFCCYIAFPIFQKAKGNIPFHLFALKRYIRYG